MLPGFSSSAVASRGATLHSAAMRFLLVIALTTSAFAAEFPAPFNTEPASGGPMPPDQAAAAVKTPAGFHVTMFEIGRAHV